MMTRTEAVDDLLFEAVARTVSSQLPVERSVSGKLRAVLCTVLPATVHKNVMVVDSI